MRGKEIQRKALIAAVACGMILFLISPYLSNWFIAMEGRYLALLIGGLIYFGVQFLLFLRT